MIRRRATSARALGVLARTLVWAARALAITLLLLPIALVVVLSFGAEQYTVIPPGAYSLRWYRNIVTQPEFVPAFVASLKVAMVVTLVSLVAGTLAAFAVARYRFPGRDLIETLAAAPITVPQVVTGSALLVFFSRFGVAGSFESIVVGHVIITMPYVVRTVTVALARYDRTLDEAAMGLGARPWQVWWKVTLPVIRPGLFAGGLFAFIMSFDDFTVTIFLLGADLRLLPVAIYQYMEWNLDPTVSAVSAVLIVMATGVTLLIERLVGLDRFIGIRG